MGHGKETPRQKLIGMMYLVLLALLAINTSKEVLNAFSVLDDGLNKTILTLTTNNDKIMADFGAQFSQNEAKVAPWLDKANKVKETGDAVVELIEDYKKKILEHAGENLDEIYHDGKFDGMAINGKDVTDAPFFIMVGDMNDKGGKEVKLAIEEFRDYLVGHVFNIESTSTLRETTENMLNTEDIEPHEGHEGHTWESEHFAHLPMSGVMSIMSGLQISVKNAQSDALKYLYSQIDAGSFKFNRLEATVIPNSSYIIRGNEYKAEVFLAASDTTASPVVYVTTNPNPYDSTLSEDGQSWNYSKRDGVSYEEILVEPGTGKGKYSVPANALGEKRWGGLIEMMGPSGNSIVRPFKRRYMVAEGSVTVAPTKMNVFYLGVDNPVDVSVAGVQPDQIEISVTNARHVKQGGSYIIRPIRPGNAYVVVYAKVAGQKKEMDRKEFRVKTVPDPVAKVSGQKGGAISQNVLAAQIGVVAEMENFDFDLKFTVTEFTVSAVVQGFVREYTSKSNRFTQEQKNLIKNLSRGNNVYIQDIKAVGPDGSTRPLSTINFRLN